MVDAAKEWPKLAEAFHRGDWLIQEEFIGEGLVNNQEELRRELSEEFKKRNTEEVNESLRGSGVTYGFIGRITDCLNDDQFLETETLVPMKHERMPGLYTINSPFRIKDEEKKQPYRAPELGEHSKEILGSLGMDEDKINKLKENGVIEF